MKTTLKGCVTLVLAKVHNIIASTLQCLSILYNENVCMVCWTLRQYRETNHNSRIFKVGFIFQCLIHKTIVELLLYPEPDLVSAWSQYS